MSLPSAAIPGRLRRFIADFAELVESDPAEPALLARGGALLRGLVAQDDWLPEPCAVARTPYAQYRLHRDARDRFSVVSFVWGAGQGTPAHDHGVWGLVGVLRGAEIDQPLVRTADGLEAGRPTRLEAGQVHALSPRLGDIHTVTNALADGPSISIHVYGADIGTRVRRIFDATGKSRRFVSGYADIPLADPQGGEKGEER